MSWPSAVIGVDVDVGQEHDVHQRHARLDALADLHLPLGDDAIDRRPDFEYSDDQLKDMFALNDDELKRLKSIKEKPRIVLG